MGYPMPVPHADAPVHDHMKVDVIIKPHLSDVAFLQSDNAFYPHCPPSHFFFRALKRHFIHKLRNRRPNETVGVIDNDPGCEKRRDVICALIPLPPYQSHGNPNEDRGGCYRVASMVPRIGLYRGAIYRDSHPDHEPEQEFLDKNDRDKNKEGEWRGSMMGDDDFSYALHDDD